LVLGANAVDTDRILSKQSKRFKLKSRLVGESDFINQRNQYRMELLEQPMSTGDNFKNLVKTQLSMPDAVTEVEWKAFNDGGEWQAVHVTTGGRQLEINSAGNLFTRINVEKGDGSEVAVYGTNFEAVQND
jgi:hypothetical protein